MQVLERGFPGEGPVGPTEAKRDMAFFIVDLRDGSMGLEASLPGSEVLGKREDTWHGSMPVLFGRRAVAAVAHGHAYLAVTDSMVLTRYDDSGDEARIAFDDREVPTRDHWERLLRDSIRADLEAIEPGQAAASDGRNFMLAAAEFRLSLLEDLPARATLPSFSTIRGGSDGRLWIQGYPNPEQDDAVWVVLDDRMQPEGRLLIPRAFNVLDLAHDRVAVHRRLSTGEEVVEVYRMVR